VLLSDILEKFCGSPDYTKFLLTATVPLHMLPWNHFSFHYDDSAVTVCRTE